MTPRKFFRYASVFGFALIPLLGFETGCSRSASTPASPEKAASQMLAGNLKTTVDAYNKSGSKSPIWDDSAQKCLTAFAHLRAQDRTNESWNQIVATNAAAAMDAGCTDPMISYLYIRFAMPQTNSKVEFAKRFYETANTMNASAYPTVRKFYGTARALDQWYYTYDTQKDDKARDVSFGLLTDLYTLTGMVLNDKTLPPREASEIVDLAMNLGSRTDLHNKTMFYDTMEQTLMNNFPDSYLPWSMKGSHYVELAWGARGDGYADTVTKEGWEGVQNKSRHCT